jgi:cell division protein FtsI/penicillin-binding protein 2
MAEGRFLAFAGADGQALFAETTLDLDLQAKAFQWLKKTRAKRAALVVMDPLDGEILALAGYRGDGQSGNAALAETFPAASLFKIVTAAAALEKTDYEAESPLAYDGGKHTLRKGNVDKAPEEGRWRTTLKEGFAESNNGVFGKIGAYGLKPGELAEYARRFYFNRPFEFELPVAASFFEESPESEPFRLAELASGYNRETKIGPLHGAMLAAAVVGGGALAEPTLAREVFDLDNNVYYESKPKALARVVSEDTAKQLSELMEAAVTNGTGRRHFADAGEHPLLSGLVIGGKTGTMNDEEGARVEWFVAYSYWPEAGSGPAWPLAMAAVVASDGKAQVDSQELVRRALIAYYQPLLDGSAKVYR